MMGGRPYDRWYYVGFGGNMGLNIGASILLWMDMFTGIDMGDMVYYN